MTEKKFSLKHKTEDIRWDATASRLELKDLPKAPKPPATAAASLTEMRQLMRRFIAKATVEGPELVQPVEAA